MACFGVPYAELAHSARYFLNEARHAWQMAETSKVCHDLADKLVGVPDTALIFAAQRNSRATQVFAAMAVEGAINTFGIVHFGHDTFEKQFGAGAIGDRLVRLVRDALGEDLRMDDPVVVSLRSLSAKRNAIVHVRPIEILPDQHGVLRSREPNARELATLAVAEEAVEEMQRIVKWLRELDAAAYPFLGEWPI
jgi:hypothetical protein